MVSESFKTLLTRQKQLYSAVHQGRAIGFNMRDEGLVTGYLCGDDSQTYMVYAVDIPQYDTTVPLDKPILLLLERTNIIWMELYEERSFREHPFYDAMKSVVEPFQTTITNKYFKV